MASRPVFIPSANGPLLVSEPAVEFEWAPGMALSQARKRVHALHAAAAKKLELRRVLEISSKSLDGLGVSLSAFNLRISCPDGVVTTVECAYQSAKRFELGGPFRDLRTGSASDARGDSRLRSSGRLVGFSDPAGDWGLKPDTAFYDWLYLTALQQSPHLSDQLLEFDGFTDIAFNPEKSLSCQARSAALFVALTRRGTLRTAMSGKEAFIASAYATQFRVRKESLFDTD